MSLRLRLTIIYTALLSGVVLLLSIVVYSMVSVVVTNQVDSELEQSAIQIIDVMRADSVGEIAIVADNMNVSSNLYYQVWSIENQLLDVSDNASQLQGPMDSSYPDRSEPTFKNVQLLDEPFRVLTVPLSVEGDVYGWLQDKCSGCRFAVHPTFTYFCSEHLRFVFNHYRRRGWVDDNRAGFGAFGDNG